MPPRCCQIVTGCCIHTDTPHRMPFVAYRLPLRYYTCTCLYVCRLHTLPFSLQFLPFVRFAYVCVALILPLPRVVAGSIFAHARCDRQRFIVAIVCVATLPAAPLRVRALRCAARFAVCRRICVCVLHPTAAFARCAHFTCCTDRSRIFALLRFYFPIATAFRLWRCRVLPAFAFVAVVVYHTPPHIHRSTRCRTGAILPLPHTPFVTLPRFVALHVSAVW